MTRPIFSAVLALAMISFAGWSIASKYSPRQVAPPPIEAPTHPYDNDVAGMGIVEPASEVIALAVERGGVVSRVDVMAGKLVKAGQPLFSINARNYEASVAQDEAAVAAGEAAIASIDQNIIMQRDVVDQAQANLEAAEAERTRASLDHMRYAATDGPRTRSSRALPPTPRRPMRALPPRRPLSPPRASRTMSCQRDKTGVKAPVDGVILKVNVRLGEYAQAGVLQNPLMTMGRVDPLHVRADIDETDSWRVHPESPAIARLRGNPEISVALKFVRFEPYVLPKRSLSGDSSERVDTRVLQVIYAFAPKDFPAFVGQQVDVFIEAPARGGSVIANRTQAGAIQ